MPRFLPFLLLTILLFNCSGDDSSNNNDDDELTSCISPTELNTANITTESAMFSWTDISNAHSYEIRYGEPGFLHELGHGWAEFTNSNNQVIYNLHDGSEFEYYVRSICSDTEFSDWAGPYSFTTIDLNCPLVANVSFINVQSTSVQVSWDFGGNNSDTTNYYIEYGLTGYDASTDDYIGEYVNSNITNFNISFLDPGTTYDVYIWTVCSNSGANIGIGPFIFTTEN